MTTTSLIRKLGLDLGELSKTLMQIAEEKSAPNATVKTKKADSGAGSSETKSRDIGIEQIRAVLAEKSAEGYTEEVKTLIEKHGADKLSGVPESEYPVLLAEAEALDG